MKRISLKNILKKTFKNKKKKPLKKKITKANKVLKVKKRLIKNNVKIIKSKLKKNVKTPPKEVKSDSLRITKNTDQKPEIKKVKTQQSEKRIYKIKDYVVYPNMGWVKLLNLKKLISEGLMLKRMF